MSLETETILDRRALSRKLAGWRSAAIVGGVLALASFALVPGPRGALFGGPLEIARVSLEGTITEDREQLKLIDRLMNEPRVAGVILAVNSGGGTTTGGEALFEALKKLGAKKPLVAQFGTVAASAAYMAGLATDHIVARGNTITGSVGVIVQYPEFTGLLDKLGVKVNTLKSGVLKANPSPFEPLTDEARKVTQDMILEGQRWFNSLVAERRHIDPQAVPGLTLGRVFSGREAKELKLVDELGGEAEAVHWLEVERKVPPKLKIVDWKSRPAEGASWLRLGLSQAVSSLVRQTLAEWLGVPIGDSSDGAFGPSFGIDGLLSVWHPGNT